VVGYGGGGLLKWSGNNFDFAGDGGIIAQGPDVLLVP